MGKGAITPRQVGLWRTISLIELCLLIVVIVLLLKDGGVSQVLSFNPMAFYQMFVYFLF